MDTQNINSHSDRKWMYRLGGMAGIIFAFAYLIIMGLYVPMGAPPSGVEARIMYHAENPVLWWAILDLSVLTDFLLMPIAFALYFALKDIDKNKMLLGISFVLMFVILDLALTWTNYASLITLSGDYISAVDSAQKSAILTAATYPTLILESDLVFVYNTLTLSVGILLIGLVMQKSIFNKATSYMGIATGIFGIIAVFGPFLVPALSITIIFASLLTTFWVMFAGFGLYKLGQNEGAS